MLMERKAISEALSVILILVITTVIFSSVALYANQQLEMDKQTTSSVIENSKERIGELLSVIRVINNSTHIKIVVVNYGEKDICIDKILGNASVINATLAFYNGTSYTSTLTSNCDLATLNGKFIYNDEVYKPTLIITPNTYGSIQIITSKGNVFDIDIP